MVTRRDFAGRLAGIAAVAGTLSELAYAQRAAVNLGKPLPKDMVWLNANENPAGPPPASIRAMTDVLSSSGRYHYQEFGEFNAALARSEDLDPSQILVGAGSSETLHQAVDAFTSPSRPMIAISPTYELPTELARAGGRRVITVPVNDQYYADVRKIIAEAEKAGGGLIYICNPNNPTSAVTPKADIQWMVANLPANTVLLIDEAYIHFAETPQIESGLAYVRQGKPVVVTRTFSKLYGMAGLRAGFACAPPELISRMASFRNNVISIVTVRAVLAAIAEAKTLVPERRKQLASVRRELCDWMRQKDVKFIDPQANFVMIEVGRDVRGFGRAMAERGVAVGRPFPPLNNLLRVSIGTGQDMTKFREAFWSVYSA